MFVRRDRGESLNADRERTRDLVEIVRESGEAGLRVWMPPAHVSFGRRDRREDGFDRARSVAEELGYPTVVRESGGRAVAFDEGTLGLVLAAPTDGDREDIDGRYERALDGLQDALADCGVAAERGEPANSFCPGSHSLSVDGRKVVGLAQRVRREVVVVAGIVILDAERVRDVLTAVYAALDVQFEPDTVGAIGETATVDDSETVADRITATLEATADDTAAHYSR